LLLFVQNSRLVDQLTKPGRHQKTYDVWIRGRIVEDGIDQALSGVQTPAGVLKCTEVKIIGTAGPKTHLQVTLDEGKNRHIRRLFGALRDPVYDTPLKVLELKRTDFGPIHLDIPSGSWRFLTPAEIDLLCSGSSGG
jgi:23S rRNA pseudouridine2605 synthase